jgi:methylmalonyl-CoA mutase
VKEALERLAAGAKDKSANLLQLSIVAAKALATVGEISDALESVFSRYAAKTQIVEGAYKVCYYLFIFFIFFIFFFCRSNSERRSG